MSRCKGINVDGQACRNAAADNSGFCKRHHPDRSLRPSTGGEFEENVMKVLRLLGFTVERNVTILACQIDLFAQLKTGIIRHRIMVECKDYEPSNIVGIEDVKAFSGTVAAARGRAVDKGLLVTRSGFSRHAKEFAESAGIELATFSDLQNQLIDFDAYLDKLIADYDGSPVSKYFIELPFSESEDFDLGDTQIIHRPLDEAVNRILFENGNSTLALLGNFGTGKSTWCKKYARDLAIKCKAQRTTRIPVLVSLSDYDSNIDIQQLITNTLQYGYGLRIDTAICQELQRLGRFLFLFDGFDEMATRIDPDVIRENLREINKVARINANVFVLTCRTHFFRDRVQAEILADFDTLYIPEWGETELEEYLQKRFQGEWQQQLERIHGTHNLAELAQTPLFLEMITETLPKLGDRVRRSELYEKYTQDWISEQSRRRGARLLSDDRRTFITDLATRLYRDNKLSCHYTEFPSLIKTRFKIEDAAQLDYLQSDVQSCTFVTRASGGNYEFRHKSFMEFFVAKAVAEQMKIRRQDLLSIKILPPEIRQFMAELLEDVPPVELLRDWLASAQNELKDNILALMVDLRIRLSPEAVINAVENENERTLLEFLQGDTKAFANVFAEHSPFLQAYLGRLGARPEVAQDIVSEVFLRLLEGRQRLSSLKDVRNYLATTAKYRWFEYERRQHRKVEMATLAKNSGSSYDGDADFLETIPDEHLPPDERYAAEEERNSIREQVAKAISLLTGHHKVIVERVMLNGESLSDVARDLGVTMTKAYMLKSAAVKLLRKILTTSIDVQ